VRDGEDVLAVVPRAELDERRDDTPLQPVVRLAVLPARPPVLVEPLGVHLLHLVDRQTFPRTDVDLSQSLERTCIHAERGGKNLRGLTGASQRAGVEGRHGLGGQ